ncbi:MAG: potassium-transporting ATPase subunit KdpC [Anaerolineae bacterium]|nr:potassium-transporting ATPase subunit KdpC [Anaerolineae bacterium]
MIKQIKSASILLAVLAVLTGIVYPLVITGLAQVFFPNQANGSLLLRDRQVLGSELIGQQFDQPKYFWGRLSSTAEFPYNASASGGSNYSVLNPKLDEAINQRLEALLNAGGKSSTPVAVDLLTASGSGLDPHISLAAAVYQADRVASSRGLPLDTVLTLIKNHSEGPQFGFLGETRVNVLKLNLALDEIK